MMFMIVTTFLFLFRRKFSIQLNLIEHIRSYAVAGSEILHQQMKRTRKEINGLLKHNNPPSLSGKHIDDEEEDYIVSEQQSMLLAAHLALSLIKSNPISVGSVACTSQWIPSSSLLSPCFEVAYSIFDLILDAVGDLHTHKQKAEFRCGKFQEVEVKIKRCVVHMIIIGWQGGVDETSPLKSIDAKSNLHV